jgi:Arc/MetJ-type ribon-helix-helix transcriptional regulator
MATTTINISVPESMKLAIEEAIEAEGYGNTSEFFRDLTRSYLKARQEKQLEMLMLQRLSGEQPREFDAGKIREALAKRLNETKDGRSSWK